MFLVYWFLHLFLRSTIQNPEVLILVLPHFSHSKPEGLTVSCIAFGCHTPHHKDGTASVISYCVWHWNFFLSFLAKSGTQIPSLGCAMTTNASRAFTVNTGTDISLTGLIAVFRWILAKRMPVSPEKCLTEQVTSQHSWDMTSTICLMLLDKTSCLGDSEHQHPA